MSGVGPGAPSGGTGSPVGAPLTVRAASECAYDVVSLGEVMLRLDPGEGRIRTARRFEA